MDVKYSLTQNLVADFTYNTDFEADEQQINLTRFSLFFPEKREFFFENQGLVHNDERHTRTRGFPTLATRSLIVRVNRLFRF